MQPRAQSRWKKREHAAPACKSRFTAPAANVVHTTTLTRGRITEAGSPRRRHRRDLSAGCLRQSLLPSYTSCNKLAFVFGGTCCGAQTRREFLGFRHCIYRRLHSPHFTASMRHLQDSGTVYYKKKNSTPASRALV